MRTISESLRILNEINANDAIEDIKENPKQFFDSLRNKKKADLKGLGCCAWDDPDKDGKVLMLFPFDWYKFIPKGYEVVHIDDDVTKFPKKCSKDHRFGALAFGIKVKK